MKEDMEDTKNNVVQLFPIQGKKGSIGPLHTKRMKIICNSCGNTDRFVGVARIQPQVLIEKLDDEHYGVTEIMYEQTSDVDEIPTACEVCGSRNISVSIIKDDDELDVPF